MDKQKKALAELDQAFLAILGDWSNYAVSTAGEAAERILYLSSHFLSEKARMALGDFYKLYFGDKDLEDATHSANEDVDLIIAQVEVKMAAGAEPSGGAVPDSIGSLKRLSLAGLQKQLEAIIRLEKGIQRKLLPVLTSMQFEDLARHRLGNLRRIWIMLLGHITSPKESDMAVREKMARLCTSAAETELFYEIVLKREAPGGMVQSDLWFEGLFHGGSTGEDDGKKK